MSRSWLLSPTHSLERGVDGGLLCTYPGGEVNRACAWPRVGGWVCDNGRLTGEVCVCVD